MTSPFRSAEDLFRACANSGTEADWREFIDRFHDDIVRAVSRAVRRWGDTNRRKLQELVQDVYLKLCDPKRRILAGFQPERPGSEAAFIHVVATNLVNDHFKSASAEIHGGGLTQVSIEQNEAAALAGNQATVEATERGIFMREIDECLTSGKVLDRDRRIFWFYYRHGMTSREIAELPGMDLTTEGVESVIYRVTGLVRKFVAGTPALSNKTGQ